MHTPAFALHLIQILLSAFLAILFLQSGIDKVVDRRGNVEWLKGHFAKSPLAGMVPLMVSVITLLELAAGILSAIGCVVHHHQSADDARLFWRHRFGDRHPGLFFGQRMAKEYAGAAVLVPYFLLTLLAIYVLAVPE